MVQRVHDLSIKYNITLPGTSLAGMLRDMTLRSLLNPIADVLRSSLRLVEDTMGQAESEMWQAFLEYYGVLSNMSKSIPELEIELRPVKEFMARKRRSVSGAPSGSNA
jgi:hypothetical protein